MKRLAEVKTKTRCRGFSLGELMITVAIIGIIGAFAIPAYQDYMLKGRRTEAKSMIMKIAQRFERCFTEFNTYVNSATAPTCPQDQGSDAEIQADNPLYYTFDINTPTTTTYTITATVSSTYGQDRDTDCQTFTLDHAGIKTSSPGSTCWTR